MLALIRHYEQFQSTLSMRRATANMMQFNSSVNVFQSTLSMRRATIQSTTLNTANTFQSTLSMRRATTLDCKSTRKHVISIHALHEESDADEQG